MGHLHRAAQLFHIARRVGPFDPFETPGRGARNQGVETTHCNTSCQARDPRHAIPYCSQPGPGYGSNRLKGLDVKSRPCHDCIFMTGMRMVLAPERKLFLGARLKRLRREIGLTQARMAQDLNVSPSYLNHLERNQRPLTAQILLRLAETYDIDIRALSGGEGAPSRDLGEVLIDPIFRDLAIPRHEIAEVAENAPGVSDAIVRLYRAFSDRRRFADVVPATGEAPALTVTPSDWVRDYIESQHNFYPELDEIGEALADALDPEPQDVGAAAIRRLAERHGVQVRIAPMEVLPEQLRRFDHHRRRLMLSERLGAAGRAFAVTYQLGLLEHGPDITALMERAAAPDLPTANLLPVSLANCLSTPPAIPYEPLHPACH